MTFTPASTPSLIAFLLVVAFVLCATIAGFHFASRRAIHAAVGLGLWLLATSALSATDWLAAHPMPGVPVFFAMINIGALALALSRAGRRLAAALPLGALIGFQGFRLPLELVLHSWAEQGVIPGTMTWTGQNWDIISGIVAILAAPFAGRYRSVAWSANLLGIVLLLNVARVAMMSSPLPFAWSVEPPLQLALYLPYAWIASVCVAGALAGHVVLTRALILDRA